MVTNAWTKGEDNMANYIIEFSTKHNLDINIMQEQKIDTHNVTGIIKQESDRFILNLQGEKEDVINIIRSVWELASLYDGYFYEPVQYFVDGVKKTVDDLYFLSFYKSGNIWKYFAMTLVGADKDFSAKMIKTYNDFRNKGRVEGQLCKSMINSFYYLHSKNYDGINVSHRLSLLLNLCDGLAINIYGTNNVSSSVARIIKTTMASDKVKYGASLLGIPKSALYNALANERNEIDHYVIKAGSVSEYEMKAHQPIRDHINLYFTYVVELAMRITILNKIGCNCKEDLINSALDTVNDWIILECDLQVDCGKEINRFRQKLRGMGIDIR